MAAGYRASDLLNRSRTSVAWCEVPTIYTWSGNSSSEGGSTASNPASANSSTRGVATRLLSARRSSPLSSVLKTESAFGRTLAQPTKRAFASSIPSTVAQKPIPCRLTKAMVHRVLSFVAGTRDLRSCSLVCKLWRSAVGPFNGPVAALAMNSWAPFTGVWWIPCDAVSLFIVCIDSASLRGASKARGWKLQRQSPPLSKVDVLPRAVRADFDAITASIRWFIPLKTEDGPRTTKSVTSTVFEASAVVGLSRASMPCPGKRIPKQLYLNPSGGTLKRFPDSHLRRPRSRAAHADPDLAISQLTTVLERSDWVNISRSYQVVTY
ncbi:hypothetical protein DIPPA_30174 [Diplonema papillatum]|nr:hypothetical protein DIPPA_30174 [Diplonema papillatum]